MQMPGNDELSIQERAHLLKLGVHGVALLRLAYRYEPDDDRLYLSNGLFIDETFTYESSIWLLWTYIFSILENL